MTSFFRGPAQGTMNFGELVVDNFAGGGGASMGIELGIGRPVDIAINHDIDAIRMHEVNHPHTQHFCESVWDVDPVKVTAGRPVGLAWFSPDCKHFSKARGAVPVSKKIRGLAWVALRWAGTVKPRVIMLENVEEFQTWGPVRKNEEGNYFPCPKRKGRTFQSFKNALHRLGYVVEHRELRACDYGAPTSRKRFFLIARCDGHPIVWPEPTHGPGRIPYRTAADIIDWSLPCPSIFDRKKPLADATLRRIAEGLRRFVIESAEPFIVPIAHYNGRNTVHDINDPLRTITAHPKGGAFALCTPTLIQTGYGERKGQRPRVPGLHKPLGTVVADGQKHALVTPILVGAGGPAFSGKPVSADQPLGTVTTENRRALVTAFIAKHYGGATGAPVFKPLPTTTARGTQNQLVTTHLVKLRRNQHSQSVKQPIPTLTAGGGHVGEVRAFLIKYYGTEKGGISLKDPLDTIPCRDRFGLVMVHGEPYQIVDIGMRMLSPRELFNAQGFPADYVIDHDGQGKAFTKTAQVARCGNSVCPPLSEVLVRANMTQIAQQVAA
jgi:DNA (cytosine-5)-methyltransferase 1